MMSKYIFYPANRSPVLLAASEALKSRGYGVVSRPCESVTHILFPVPTFAPDGSLKGGGDFEEILACVPKATVVGGNLPSVPGRKTMDLLKDPYYLADNAAITAYCTLGLLMEKLPMILRNCKVLIIGWGRIAKCLAALLWALEADVTVGARKPEDRAMAHALGYKVIELEGLGHELNEYQVICSTPPEPVLDEEQLSHCRDGCLKVDLASRPGLIGPDVIHARGLPGLRAPASSGKLIAKTVIRLLGRKEEVK